ncbi:MAG TPA: HAMP domain-containing sensor histidine kinase, partial [Flavisolibacter sp.]|nr:HAMP domain-containing sensor histidine kinase [Flavisolibacter sp.]
LQLVTGILVPAIGLIGNQNLPYSAVLVASIPSLASMIVLYLNHRQLHEIALIMYFALYPFLTCVVYLNGMNIGNELFFILYGILSVFFLKDFGHIIFTIGFSMISYYMLTVIWNQRQYGLATANLGMYRFNQALAAAFIYYGLFLIKRENNSYQFRLLRRNRTLHHKNEEIQQQKNEFAELNALKTKLFSVIAHDLKTPIYALRSLFSQIEKHNLPAEEVKAFVPQVVVDLNYTVSLMENLLQWAKTQMDSYSIQSKEVDVQQLIKEVVQLLHSQAAAKNIYLVCPAEEPVHVFADKEMISLVLRNLVSNAIKFTPTDGRIELGINNCDSFVEVYVEDTGTGISPEALKQINANSYYTTKGTANESGTGLGLMLCKEFLNKNGGQLFIESEAGKGSIISFTLPTPQDMSITNHLSLN